MRIQTPNSREKSLRIPWFSRLCRTQSLLRGVIIIGLFCTALGLFYAEENWRGQRAWQKCRQDLVARGVELDWHAAVPQPVPDEENFAMTPFLAAAFDFAPGTYAPRDTRAYAFVSTFGHLGEPFRRSIDPIPPWNEGRRIDLEEALRLLHKQKVEPLKKNNRSNEEPSGARKAVAVPVLNALEEFSPVLDELRASSARPKSRFNLNYKEKEHWNLAQPHLDVLRKTSVILAVRASAELAVENSAAAMDDLGLMIFLADSIREEPLWSSQWARGLLLGHARQVIWEGLADRRWSDAQLEQLQFRLQQIDLLGGLTTRLKLERATGDQIFEMVRERPAVVKGWFGPGFVGWARRFVIRRRPSGWLDQDRIYYHRLWDKLQPGLNLEGQTISPKIIKNVARVGFLPLPDHLLANALFEGPGDILMDLALAQTAINETILACALERYRLIQGGLPETLDALNATSIKKALHDVITGEPLKYQRISDGRFKLYSIGWNETDDGGIVATNKSSKATDSSQGDWVWPSYPVK